MIEYPKIETLYDRDPVTRRVDPGKLRLEEFALPRRWLVTEKVDGTNIRVGMTADGTVSFAGRSDKADIPPHLMAHLVVTYTPEKMRAVFHPEGDEEVVLFVEGFGHKVQKGGENYRPDVGTILFDAWLGGWWLEPDNLIDVAKKLEVPIVPYRELVLEPQPVKIIGDGRLPESAEQLAELLGWWGQGPGQSFVATQFGRRRQAEGVVARTLPLLLMRDGRRLMWKLKFRDFADYREERGKGGL